MVWFQISQTSFLPQIEDWQKRPLDDIYPIVFIDAVHFSVRDIIKTSEVVSLLLYTTSEVLPNFGN